MALRALMLKKKIDEKRKNLDDLIAKSEEFSKREAELSQAIEEANTDEEKATVEEAINLYETEKAESDESKAKLENEINELETELAGEEKEQEIEETTPNEEKEENRGKEITMETRIFKGLDQLVERSEVKEWLGDIRSAMKEKRAISNVGQTIPETLLPLLKENVQNYSKLYKHVNVQRVSGEARQVIQGTVSEAVWTECCANLNEMNLGFNDVTVDCHKVGGYYAVCNANIEDSDYDLASDILAALGQGIGLALDKAIDYGKVSGMPLGIVTRLAQTAQPEGYPATARPWADLTGNIVTIPASTSGVDLFKAIVMASGKAKGAYARGGKVWQMNEATYTSLLAEGLTINANGAIVSGVNGAMPVVGGIVEVLEFIPDNVIIGGYMDLYLLAERAGQKFATSEHVRFLQDQTVFKGTARYDGTPVIPEGFVVIGLNGVTPSADMTFASDSANDTEGA